MLYGKFFKETKKQYFIIFSIEHLVFVNAGKIYGVTSKKINKENNINGKAK